MADKPNITPKLIRQLLRCNPSTGILFWESRRRDLFPTAIASGAWNSNFSGREAGCFHASSGYIVIKIYGRSYQAHRLIWAYHYGEWPKGQIDHLNGVRTDNRLENLRDVSRKENMRNAAMPKNNTSGVCGVSWSNRRHKWEAVIMVDRKNIHLGAFEDINEAAETRKKAEFYYGFHPNHGRKS